MASHAVEIEDIVICVFLLVPSGTYRFRKPQRWDRPDSSILIGALRSQNLELHESDAFGSPLILQKVIPHLTKFSRAIEDVLPDRHAKKKVLDLLVWSWVNTVARICIGLRRSSTGGSLLISAKPRLKNLSFGHRFHYSRLRDALVLDILDDLYLRYLESWGLSGDKSAVFEANKLIFARVDAEDRKEELRGAVKLVTSLAALDGAVLLTPDLDLSGFSIKIGASSEPHVIYDGEDFARKGKKAKTVNLGSFGTRHSSVIRYCRADPQAIGVIVSQDGHVRIAATENKSVVLWDRVQLLNRSNFTKEVAKTHREYLAKSRRYRGALGITMGYSPMPKTTSELTSKRFRRSL
jgi:hypothetical protein